MPSTLVPAPSLYDDVQVTSGLGSSSAAVCAGILAARALATAAHGGTSPGRGEVLSDDDVLELATDNGRRPGRRDRSALVRRSIRCSGRATLTHPHG